MKQCPCCSGNEYDLCCKPFHKGKVAPTPLTLMRSRFAAYALGDIAYVMKTWDKRSPLRPKNTKAWRADLTQFAQSTDFVGLKIMADSAEDKTGTVTFKALLFQNGQDISYIEQSFFNKQGNRWVYYDAADRTNHERRKPD